MRRTRGGTWVLRAGVFVLGALFVVLGGVLIVLPGPLTIPPVLLGLYIWSTEFAWAERLRDRAAEQGQVAWQLAKRKPVHTSLVTGGGLLLAVFLVAGARRFGVVDRVLGTFG
ncbi:MAG: hypothetical protein JWN35_694 [Frankiales bacterium]|jgi:hypothetical protein|nr:hypothetical protein [Frankiales bacterium]